MKRAGNLRTGKALLAGRAFRILLAMLAIVIWFAPASAQTASQKKPAAKSPTTKPATPKSSVKKKPVSRRSRARGQTKPTTDRVSAIQSALAREGFYSGDPNGAWDSKSVAAMKRFQEAKRLKPTGKIDARSLQLLGLGSETAGMAAPREPVAAASSSSQ